MAEQNDEKKPSDPAREKPGEIARKLRARFSRLPLELEPEQPKAPETNGRG